ncbi:MAG: AbrB/MazE/SpoVT family DNA-binding domain-containing protein [Defluviitaleaceae bacterium]|nr:AbrB/MazE/SpoVT family DNA-binding domain-containing protein [Defluviitaleaceae bacterium]
MKNKTIVDSLGRVTVPRELREEANFKIKDKFEVEIRNGKVILSKAEENGLKITKAMDDMSRIVLPIDIRRALGFREGDELQLNLEQILVLSKSSIGGKNE